MYPSLDLLPEYRRLRAALRSHQNAAVKTIPTTPFRRYAREFGLLQGNQLVLESESELTILMDFCLYHHRQRGKTLIERYFDRCGEPENEDEHILREAVRHRRFAVVEVQRVQSGLGMSLRDLLRGDELFLVDESLSSTVTEGRVGASNLLPLPAYWMTTGAFIPFPEEVTVNEALLSFDVQGGSLSPEAETELASDILAFAFETGATSLAIYI